MELNIFGEVIDERQLLLKKYAGVIKTVMEVIIDNPKIYDLPPEKVKQAIITIARRKNSSQSVFTLDRSIRKVWSMAAFKPPENVEIWRRKEQQKHSEMFRDL